MSLIPGPSPPFQAPGAFEDPEAVTPKGGHTVRLDDFEPGQPENITLRGELLVQVVGDC